MLQFKPVSFNEAIAVMKVSQSLSFPSVAFLNPALFETDDDTVVMMVLITIDGDDDNSNYSLRMFCESGS